MAHRQRISASRFVFSKSGVDATSATLDQQLFNPLENVYQTLSTVIPIPASSFTHESTGGGFAVYSATVSLGKTFPDPPQVYVLVKSADGSRGFYAPALMNYAYTTVNGITFKMVQFVWYKVTTTSLTVRFSQVLEPGGRMHWPAARDVSAMVLQF